jgi:hypothetical protein
LDVYRRTSDRRPLQALSTNVEATTSFQIPSNTTLAQAPASFSLPVTQRLAQSAIISPEHYGIIVHGAESAVHNAALIDLDHVVFDSHHHASPSTGLLPPKPPSDQPSCSTIPLEHSHSEIFTKKKRNILSSNNLPIISDGEDLVQDMFTLDGELDGDFELQSTPFSDPEQDLEFNDINLPEEDSEASKIYSRMFLNCVDDPDEFVNTEQAATEQMFYPVDEEDIREIEEGGINRSEASEKWFKNRFVKWQLAKNFHVGTNPEDLPPAVLAKGLVPFILGVRKLNGQFYPSQTLALMFRACARFIRRHQIKRCNDSLVDEAPIILQKHAFFEKARLALVKAMDRSIKAGANKPRKKSNPILWKDEHDLLADRDISLDHPHGVQKRFAWYCLSRFVVRGASELHKLEDIDFSTGEDDYGSFVRYSERDSKNYHASMTKFQQEHFREPVTCHEPDVVSTYRQLIRHMPPKEDPKKGRHIFLQAIRGNCRTNAWFNTNNIVVKVLAAWCKNMMALLDAPGSYTNKSPRYTTIQKMILAGVPNGIGMAITGHKNEGSYRRYDQNIEVEKMAAMDILACPFKDGKRRMYADVLKEFSVKNDMLELAGTSSGLTILPANRDQGSTVSTKQASQQEVQQAVQQQVSRASQQQAVQQQVSHASQQQAIEQQVMIASQQQHVLQQQVALALEQQVVQQQVAHAWKQQVVSSEELVSAVPQEQQVSFAPVRVEALMDTTSVTTHKSKSEKVVNSFYVPGDIANLKELGELENAMLREWPEGAKYLGFGNTYNNSTSESHIGTSINNCNNCTFNITVDPSILKNIFNSLKE